MRVYVKKEDRNPMFPGIIVMTIFLSFSIGMFIAFIQSDKPFIETLASAGSLLLFAIIFFAFGIYFAHALIKKPKAFLGQLVSKKSEIYKGKNITSMVFRIRAGKEQKEECDEVEYQCYTKGENNLILEKEYVLKIKEFNWEIKYVKEMIDEKNEVVRSLPEVTLYPVLLAILFFFGGMVFLCILGLIFYPENLVYYISFGICFGIGFYKLFKSRNKWK